jgi:hypothetical protein
VGRWLLVGLLWVVLGFAPTLSLALAISSLNLQGSRFFYLPSVGYCIGAAALLLCAFAGIGRSENLRRNLAATVCLVLLGAFAVLSWINLRPWQTASVHVLEINQQLRNLIPPQPRPKGTLWNVQDIPDTYQGAYMYRLGLGNIQRFTRGPGETPAIEIVPSTRLLDKVIQDTDFGVDKRDVYALRFKYDERTRRYNIIYLTGITGQPQVPAEQEGGFGLKVWDFTACAPENLSSWHATSDSVMCEPDSGLLVRAGNPDTPQLLGPGESVDLPARQAWYLRLRAAVTYPAAGSGAISPSESTLSTWHWRFGSEDWNGKRSRSLPAVRDGQAHVYWTYLTIDEAPRAISELRFDPAVGGSDAVVSWIAIDFVR